MLLSHLKLENLSVCLLIIIAQKKPKACPSKYITIEKCDTTKSSLCATEFSNSKLALHIGQQKKA
jgi:hypothetical protein